jgi:VPS13-like, N-terminal
MLFDSAIHSYISGYFKNEEKTLNISLWNGKVDITNAELNLDLPFVNISKAFFKSFSLTVPWTTMLTDSVTVIGHGLSMEIVADEPPPVLSKVGCYLVCKGFNAFLCRKLQSRTPLNPESPMKSFKE